MRSRFLPFALVTALAIPLGSHAQTPAAPIAPAALIDDIVTGIVDSLDRPPADARAPRLLNIGNHRVEEVRELVRLLEEALGRKAVIRSAPRPSADVEATFASIEAIGALTGFAPTTPLAVGIPRFVAWFRQWQGS